MRPPIHSRKHIVQVSLATVTQGAVGIRNIAQGIEGAASAPTQVSEGALVKAVWVEMWAGTESATTVTTFTAGVYKNPGGGNQIVTAEAAALHDWTNKKNLLYTTQALLPLEEGGLMMIYKGWIKIPKGKQRMGLGDSLQFFIRNNNASAIDIIFCGLFLYKEYQ